MTMPATAHPHDDDPLTHALALVAAGLRPVPISAGHGTFAGRMTPTNEAVPAGVGSATPGPGRPDEEVPLMGNRTQRALQTRYAGCHFRSRLEARWAVFFDTVGIAWEYEPEGIECDWRLNLNDETFNYLPDFYLPGLEIWAEVKGEWTTDECDRFLNAAASIGAPCGGCGRNDFVVLGTIPRAVVGWRPWRIHMHKGDMIASPWFDGNPCRGLTFARDVGGMNGEPYLETGNDITDIARWLLHGTTRNRDTMYDELFTRGTTAARSARFEWGQSGAT